MALKNQVSNVYGVGLRNVGSYQVSGVPYMTGSTAMTAQKTLRHTLPHVSKSITVINPGTNDIRIHFQSGSGPTITGDGAGGQGNYDASDDVQGKHHYTTIPASNGSATFDVRVKEIYVTNPNGSAAKYEIFAELTQIPTGRMFKLTGSGITG